MEDTTNDTLDAPTKDHRKEIQDRDGVGHTYRMLRYFGAIEGFEHLPKVTSMLGEPLGHAVDAVTAYGDQPDYTALGRSIHMIAQHAAEAGGAEWFRELLKHVVRSRPLAEGERSETGDGLAWDRVYDRFDDIYSGNYGEMLQAVQWAVTVQYSPFGGGALGAVEGQLTQLSDVVQKALIGEVVRLFGLDSPESTESDPE